MQSLSQCTLYLFLCGKISDFVVFFKLMKVILNPTFPLVPIMVDDCTYHMEQERN